MIDMEFDYISEDDLANLFLEIREIMMVWINNHREYSYESTIDSEAKKITIKVWKCI